MAFVAEGPSPPDRARFMHRARQVAWMGQLIAASFVALAAYICVVATSDLVGVLMTVPGRT